MGSCFSYWEDRNETRTCSIVVGISACLGAACNARIRRFDVKSITDLDWEAAHSQSLAKGGDDHVGR